MFSLFTVRKICFNTEKIFTVLRRTRALLHAECLARRPGCGGPRHVEADAVQHGDGRVRGLRGADEEVLHILETEIMIMIMIMFSKFTVMRQQNLIVIPLKIDIQCHETACMGAKCSFK